MSSAIMCWCFSQCYLLPAHADLSEIHRIYHTSPSLAAFEVCQGGGCARHDPLQLQAQEWLEVERLFNPAPQDAAQERASVANAIGLLEDMVGTKVGTAADRAGTFHNSAYLHQQDCNDEAINSTTYLRLLQQSGLMRFHRVLDMRTRKFFFTGWPHTAAVIEQYDDHAEFAVDSWFYDNGHPAAIVPMVEWKRGYIPADSPILQR